MKTHRKVLFVLSLTLGSFLSYGQAFAGLTFEPGTETQPLQEEDSKKEDSSNHQLGSNLTPVQPQDLPSSSGSLDELTGGALGIKEVRRVSKSYSSLQGKTSSDASLGGDSTEDWKGRPSDDLYTVGAQFGVGEFNGSIGFMPLATGAVKIVHQGFAPDINNQVFVELALGPFFVEGEVAFSYGAHLRWDFVKDLRWTFYGIGGLGGLIAGDALGNAWRLYPRFGVGAFFALFNEVWLRAEISHEFTGVGAVYRF